MKSYIIFIIFIVVVGGVLFFRAQNQFDIPKGVSVPQERISGEIKTSEKSSSVSGREIFITSGVLHSIPLDEILSGGPPKDGIPSIDNPQFISTKEADKTLEASDVGLGIVLGGEVRFYPYQILVWHEIVNDVIGGVPALVTYCPLCATGVVFDPVVDGVAYEFGVSGKLWQSNLLMYNRTQEESTESLWSQVLGEAVLGEFTGKKLSIIASDTVRYGDWKEKHPTTKVLSRDTGASRSYGGDPYGDYYTNSSVSFGATFNDTRLHPKVFVLGIEVGGIYKAYEKETLLEGTTVDTFSGKTITIEKDDIGRVVMFVGEDKKPLPYIGGFWFSWLAVHPDTELK